MKYLLVAVCLGALVGCQDHEPHGAPSAHPTASAQPSAALNPVQNEMQLLTTALEGAVRGIGLGDVRAVEHDLHRVHLAKEATGAALQSGSYKPPKNPDQLERFSTLDEAFHGDLARLVDASHRNDVPATAAALGTVMQACQGCHSEFRQ